MIRPSVDRTEDAGLGLAELLVAMFMTSMVMVFVSGFFVSVQRNVVAESASDTTSRQASTAMNQMTRYLRAATVLPQNSTTVPVLPAFESVSPTSVTFYAYVNLQSSSVAPVKVRYSVDSSSNLVQTLWPSTCQANGYCTFSAVPSSSTILAGPIAAGTTLFSYEDSDGDPVSVPTGLASASATIRSAVQGIQTVSIDLEVGTAGKPSLAVLKTDVGLLNLATSPQGASS